MKRWAATFATRFLLLMLTFTVLLWVRSYYRSDTLRWTGRLFEQKEISKLRILMIYSGQGCIEVATAQDPYWSSTDGAIAEPWLYLANYNPEHPANTRVNCRSKQNWHNFGIIVGSDEESADGSIPPIYTWGRFTTVAAGPGLILGHVESFTALWLPHWLLVLLFGAVPARKTWRWLKAKRKGKDGFCRTCGYDLRGSSERCPECGKPFLQITG